METADMGLLNAVLNEWGYFVLGRVGHVLGPFTVGERLEGFRHRKQWRDHPVIVIGLTDAAEFAKQREMLGLSPKVTNYRYFARCITD